MIQTIGRSDSQVVELPPEPGFFLVDGQGGDLGQFARQAAKHVDVLRRKLDFFRDRRRFVMAGVVKHVVRLEVFEDRVAGFYFGAAGGGVT